jgi:hypothetical protein
MNYIATSSGIENPMISHMQRISGSNSTNMTDELLNNMLNDYADLLNIIVIVMPFDGNMLIDFNRISTFNGASHFITDQQRVFILYDVRQRLFAPLYVTHIDGSLKLCFDDNEAKIIGEAISDLIFTWNSQSKYTKS